MGTGPLSHSGKIRTKRPGSKSICCVAYRPA
ncbi:Uncharacterised protein [Vibrio cholerae]|nr:Uncharacterised protein [Vibrio cholerae]